MLGRIGDFEAEATHSQGSAIPVTLSLALVYTSDKASRYSSKRSGS